MNVLELKRWLRIGLCVLTSAFAASSSVADIQAIARADQQQDDRCSAVSFIACKEFLRLGRGVNFGMAINGLNLGKGISSEEWRALEDARDRFDSFRLLLSWPDFASPDRGGDIDEKFAQQVDELIRFMTAKNGRVIVAMHRYNQLTGDRLREYQVKVDDSVMEERFVNIWKQIARRYARRYEGLIFELYNEPHGRLTPDLWNALTSRTLDSIREFDATRIVVIDAPFWANASHLKVLRLPHDKNIFVSVHAYFPFEFTHQGADWGSPRYPVGVTCCSDIQRAKIRDNLRMAAEWSQSTGFPIYVGEFGSTERADNLSRAEFIAASRIVIEGFGMSWAYWEMGPGFSIYSIKDGKWNMALLDALLK